MRRKYLSKLEKCFNDRLLIKGPREIHLAHKSLKRAFAILQEIPKIVNAALLELAVQRIYQAAFHGVKSLLYKDGVKERSHYCVSLYFKETYKKHISADALSLLDRLRDIRHESQYGLESPMLSEEQIQDWFQETQELLTTLETIINA